MRQRRWRELEWIDRFGYTVGAGFLAGIVTMALVVMLNGCSDAERPPTTLPPIPAATMTTTTIAGVLTCGPQEPPSDCSGVISLG